MAFGYPTIAIDGDCCLGFLPSEEAIRFEYRFKVKDACLFAVCSPQEKYSCWICFVQPAGTRGSYLKMAFRSVVSEVLKCG